MGGGARSWGAGTDTRSGVGCCGLWGTALGLSCSPHLPPEGSPSEWRSFLVVSVSPRAAPGDPGCCLVLSHVPRPWHSCWVTAAAARRWQGCHTPPLPGPLGRSPDGGQSPGRKGVVTGLLCPVSRGQRWMCMDWGLVDCVPTQGRAGREQYRNGGHSTGLTPLGLWGV